MSRPGFLRTAGLARRLVLLLAVFAASPIALACRGSKERPAPAAESRNATPARSDVPVDRAGKLLKVIGAAGEVTSGAASGIRVFRAGRDVTAELGMELREGDRVVTDAATRAVIGSDVSSEISMGPNTELTIRKESGFLGLGSLFVTVARLFRVETKFVVAGVEGTEFSVTAESDVTKVSVLEGSVRVQPRVGRWAPRAYRAGEECIARGEREPVKRVLDRPMRERLLLWRKDLVPLAPGRTLDGRSVASTPQDESREP